MTTKKKKDLTEEEILSLSEEAATVLAAVKRIEEANLWKTLLSQNIFSADAARPEIVQTVNEKIKNFAREQLEMAVGLKSESQSNTIPQVNSYFDADEIQALKVLAAKLLKRNPFEAAATLSYNNTLSVTTNNTPTPPAASSLSKNKVSKNKASIHPQQVPQPKDYYPLEAKLGHNNINIPASTEIGEGAGPSPLSSFDLSTLINHATSKP